MSAAGQDSPARSVVVPWPGQPCPNGCAERGNDGRERPVLIRESCPGSGDGEVSCPACWDAWNVLAGTAHGGAW